MSICQERVSELERQKAELSAELQRVQVLAAREMCLALFSAVLRDIFFKKKRCLAIRGVPASTGMLCGADC